MKELKSIVQNQTAVRNDNLENSIKLESMLGSASMVITICILGWVFWYSRYGIDFTDEGYYLVWMATPFNYSVSASQFGFIYHPLYKLVNGNIVALRCANILITYALAWLLSSIFLRTAIGMQALEKQSHLAVSAALATGGLVFLASWLPTPSYNSLTLQALLIATSGLLLLDKEKFQSVWIAGVLIGIGGWLAFMAKPTTAAALCILSIAYLSVTKKIGLGIAIVSLLSALIPLAISAMYIDGSLLEFIFRLKQEMLFQKIFGVGHDFGHIFRIDTFDIGYRGWLTLALLVGFQWMVVLLFQAKSKVTCLTGYAIYVLLILLILFFPEISGHVSIEKSDGLLIWAVPFAAILSSFQQKGLREVIQALRHRWALALIFLMLPHVFALGTGNNYWEAGSKAGFFWILAGLALSSGFLLERRKLTRMLLILGIGTQFLSVVLIGHGIEAPYRQPQSLLKNTYVTEVGRTNSDLVLDEGFGAYIESAKKLSVGAGFRPNTPVIDLTGQSPTILYAMQGKILGRPWTPGGYPGSNEFASLYLRLESCKELAVAWLLLEPGGPRSLSPEILAMYGADLNSDFYSVGNLYTPKGAGGYDRPRLQVLLKPARSTVLAVDSCSKKKDVKINDNKI